MNRIKDIYTYINICWNIKEMSKHLIIMTLIIAVMMVAVGETFLLFALPVLYIVPTIFITIDWFTRIKPMVEEVKKEVEIERKYPFFLNRFNR